MDTNTCNVNHMDADALLPPRKRLLAGLKRQNSDVNSPVPLPTTPSGDGSESDCFNTYRSWLNNPNLSNEGIIEASRIAAVEASRVAEVARANAEEKATKAAKAVAIAKCALELVAALSRDKDAFPKKNKMKKHVPVEALYNNSSKNNTNCSTDEELARKLHQAINSSPRISKNSSSSDLKSHKHKKLKYSSNGNGVVKDVNTEGPVKKIDVTMVDLNGSNHTQRNKKLDNGEEHVPSRTDVLKLEKSKVDAIFLKDKFAETLGSLGKKRKLKQKKLPLSICSFRDQSIPKEELKPQGMPQLENNAVRTMEGKNTSFSTGSGNIMIPVERTSVWKCQSLKVASRVNKVMQS